MTFCPHCGEPDETGTLCASCRTAYWRLIRQLGHVQLPALTSIMLRQARIWKAIHKASQGVVPLPIDTTAQKLIDESEAWLAEQAGKIRTAYASYGWRKAWRVLLDNKHTVLTMSTAADDYTALERISRRNETALTPEEERILVGPCPTCHADVYAVPEAETAECRNCHGEWPTQALRTVRNERFRKIRYTGTPKAMARELKRYCGLTASRNLLSQWIRRGKIHATPTNTKGEYEFNLGELVTLLDCHR